MTCPHDRASCGQGPICTRRGIVWAPSTPNSLHRSRPSQKSLFSRVRPIAASAPRDQAAVQGPNGPRLGGLERLANQYASFKTPYPNQHPSTLPCDRPQLASSSSPPIMPQPSLTSSLLAFCSFNPSPSSAVPQDLCSHSPPVWCHLAPDVLCCIPSLIPGFHLHAFNIERSWSSCLTLAFPLLISILFQHFSLLSIQVFEGYVVVYNLPPPTWVFSMPGG